jgi:uncharacterized protein YjbI with pentapeptide repeats
MANVEHFAKLLEGINAWNSWREADPDIKPDLSDVEIGDEDFLEKYQGEKGGSHLDFEQANFSFVNFKGAGLSNLNLSGAKLHDSSFLESMLNNIVCHGGDWSDADFTATQFTEPDFFESDFQSCNFHKAKFWNGANLKDCNFWGANMDNAILSGVDLENAQMGDTSMVHANLEGANLKSANLWAADLQDANLSSAQCHDTNMLNVNLTGGALKDAVLERAILEDACFKNSNMQGVDLRFADMSRCIFEHADMTGVLFNKNATYSGIRTASCYGAPSFKRFADDQDFVEELKKTDWDPLVKLRENKNWRWAKPVPTGKYLFWLWEITSDCGRSLLRWSLLTVVLAAIFSLAIYLMGPTAFHVNSYDGVQLPWTFGTTMYYSIVTFSTLGYGDILPKTPGAAYIIMAEVGVGYMMLGGLISILAGKMARRA